MSSDERLGSEGGSSAIPDVLFFGPFSFDTAACRLSREGVEIHLTPKAAAVLCYLLRKPGALISKDEFLEGVWEGVHVREESLTQAISVIRQALGDSAQSPEYIETVSGEGYRFVGEVSTATLPVGADQRSAGSPADPGGSTSIGQPPRTASHGRQTARRLSREVLATAAVVVVAIGALAWLWPEPPGLATGPDLATVTSYPGYENYPTLSPDGRQVAFMWNAGNGPYVYVRFVSGGDPLALAEASYGDVAWDPYGEQIAYMRDLGLPAGEEGPRRLEVRVITPHGTNDRRITATAMFFQRAGLDWSPDGRFLAFPDRASPDERPNIFLYSLDKQERHQVTFHGRDEATFDWSPAFSPDGRYVAFIRERSASGQSGFIYVQQLDDEGQPVGDSRRLASPDGLLHDVDWTADGSAVVYSAGPVESHPYLSIVPLDGGGEPSRLWAGERARDFSIEGSRLVYSERQDDIDLWRVGGPTAAEPGEPERWCTSTLDDFYPDYSPESDRVAFISGRSGSWNVWVADGDCSAPRQLSDFAHATRTRWAPDGSLIAFNVGRPDRTEVYVVDPDEGAPRTLSEGGFRDSVPGWSEDSQFIYFQSRGRTEGPEQGGVEIWRMSRDGRDPTRIPGVFGFRPLHHAGRLYVSRGNRVVSHPEDGGEPTLVLDHPIFNHGWDLWNGKLVLIEPGEPGTAVIKIFDPETEDPRVHAVVPLQGNGFVEPGGTMTVSPDGRFILYSARARPGGADLKLVDNYDFR
jgi:Tol biopolymer transport system component/DNA-binding winged helix-turn-helix (wHTH) protein